MEYATSTQRKRWLFTVDGLREARQRTRDTSLEALRAVWDQAPSGSSVPPEPITLAEEAALLKFYEAKVQAVCRELRLPRKAMGTAVTYIKRFYCGASALDHDPLPVALTCLYLACKAEECYISAAELGRLSGMPADALLRHELPVLQGLHLDLLVHTPHRAVDGCFAEVDACRAEALGQQQQQQQQQQLLLVAVDGLGALSEEDVQRAKAAAYAAADALLLTDALLLFTPGQLGLAASRSGFKKVGTKLHAFVGRVARRALHRGAETLPVEAEQCLLRVLGEIDAMGAAGSTPVLHEDVAAIDRKLKACRSPLLDASSEPARAGAAARTRAKADEAARKAAKLAEAQASREAGVGVLGSTGVGSGERGRKRGQEASDSVSEDYSCRDQTDTRKKLR